MRRIILAIINLVRALAQIAWSIVLVIFFSDHHPSLQRWRQGDSECIVLGSGPSLQADIEARPDISRGRRTICMNDFIGSDLFERIQPDYYIAADPAFWAPDTSVRLRQRFQGYAKKMAERVSWPMVIFLPTAAKHNNVFALLSGQNKNISICYVNTTQAIGPARFRHFLYRRNLAMPTMQSVLVATIFIAINLGCKKIYVLGGDNSWHENMKVDQDNVLRLSYDRVDFDTPRPSAPFTNDSAETIPYTVPEFFSWLSSIFYGYHQLADYAKTQGIEIINSSSESYIDAFPRQPISNIPSVVHRG